MITRKKKVNLARRGRTRQELIDRVSIWDTQFWNERKERIKNEKNPNQTPRSQSS